CSASSAGIARRGAAAAVSHKAKDEKPQKKCPIKCNISTFSIKSHTPSVCAKNNNNYISLFGEDTVRNNERYTYGKVCGGDMDFYQTNFPLKYLKNKNQSE
ncbi:MAG: hypothetical protein FWG98_02900, partial [Candidatus Cloacimonetes bacterium]|nr:hypothetical protein [Candidatus Cloacimonadota bacterium]